MKLLAELLVGQPLVGVPVELVALEQAEGKVLAAQCALPAEFLDGEGEKVADELAVEGLLGRATVGGLRAGEFTLRGVVA